ncbi:uncharacterized protein LOC135168213 isoform X2 [Diachasmimorpha longicaudata]|uniref:uncharacterized protein LOC135168213 isoform X2 n=1 Tax=Diachasmimorpha longicaudata TaxID=58733 RepID=UPI0030B8D9AA
MSNLPPTYVEGFHDLEAVKAMEYRPLGKTGLMVSELSFGGGPLGCHYGEYDEEEAIATIREALRKGINYIDTAPWYGQGRSERTIGRALEGIPRKAYYIATKVGRYSLDFENMFDFTAQRTRKSVEDSLKLLQLDYVDVLQVHDVEFAPSLDIIITQTLPEISRQVSQGRARFIGITGYPVSVLKECIDKSNINISVILSYARYTLIDDTLLQYIPFFQDHNIGIINASAPCMGLLVNTPPPDWHPASEETKKQCYQAVQYCNDHDLKLARLAVWYAMQHSDIATNLIGMQNLEQLRMNLDIVYNGITDEEKTALDEVVKRFRDIYQKLVNSQKCLSRFGTPLLN